jgi:hypothetical protein
MPWTRTSEEIGRCEAPLCLNSQTALTSANNAVLGGTIC